MYAHYLGFGTLFHRDGPLDEAERYSAGMDCEERSYAGGRILRHIGCLVRTDIVVTLVADLDLPRLGSKAESEMRDE